MGSIGSSMSPSARMTAASGIARQRATWPSCARSPSTSWGGTEHPGSACGRVASRPPGTMITCSLFWLADFMRRPWGSPETLSWPSWPAACVLAPGTCFSPFSCPALSYGHTGCPCPKGLRDSGPEFRALPLVSTADQKPDLQDDDLRGYAARAGLDVVQDYCDVAVSGRREGRPQLNALMAAARNHEIDCVLVWKFDRFARSTRHLLTALEEFDHLGVRFVSVQDQIDTDSPMGRAMFTIIGAMAELESSLISERVTAGMRGRSTRQTSRAPCYPKAGHQRDRGTRHLNGSQRPSDPSQD